MSTRPPADQIRARAATRRRPDGSLYQSLPLTEGRNLARQTGLAAHQIEAAALQQQILPERYARNMQSLSFEDQQTLLEARACIIGVGGLGGTVAEVLARIGLGHLDLVDGDCFEEHNLNRQRFAHTGNLGQPKAQEARHAITRINPAVTVSASTVFLTDENAEDLIASADVVIDCLDRLDVRLVLQEACRRRRIPLVSAAVAGTAGQLTVIFPGDPGLVDLVGKVETDGDRGVETRLGNLPFTVTCLASLEAAEAVKVLLGREGVLRNRLLLFDLAEPCFEIIST